MFLAAVSAATVLIAIPASATVTVTFSGVTQFGSAGGVGLPFSGSITYDETYSGSPFFSNLNRNFYQIEVGGFQATINGTSYSNNFAGSFDGSTFNGAYYIVSRNSGLDTIDFYSGGGLPNLEFIIQQLAVLNPDPYDDVNPPTAAEIASPGVGNFFFSDLNLGASGNANYSVSTSNSINAVPEPSTWAMMMFGFFCMGYAMRRRTKIIARVHLPESKAP